MPLDGPDKDCSGYWCDRMIEQMRRTDDPDRTRSSLALQNLRGVVIMVVVAFHSVLSYLGSRQGGAFPFDEPPYEWRAFPIVDSHRWLGFDIFCAWQDVSLMSLMFFLSALFTWPSLARKGQRKFLADRFLRLGVPFALALAVIMPLALYPVYRVTAVDPGLGAYARHYLALPFWPNGPMWFVWQLLALAFVAALLRRLAPGFIAWLAQLCAGASTHPGRFFAGLVVVSAIAYVPMAIAFTPWSWNEHGPFALQYSRALLYPVFYIAGLAVGAHGLERGLLAPEGMLARHWPIWLTTSLISMVVWMVLMAQVMSAKIPAPLGLRLAVDIGFAVACASGCFFALGVCIRFFTRRSRMMDSLARNAFGMYLFHYVFVVWLQYVLLGTALFAVVKAAIVFAGTAILAWGLSRAMRIVPFWNRIMGTEQNRPGPAPALGGQFATRTIV